MKKIGLVALFALLLAGCDDGGEKKAQENLRKAEAALEKENFNEAKLQIDSIRILYPKAFEARKQGVKLMQQVDFETSSRKLYHGDYLIMMTDGVLDALPAMREEETMKEIIMDIHEETPKEMSRGILERVLGYSDYCARDDMTVLVAGMWKK